MSPLPYDVIATLPLSQQCKTQFDSLCLAEVTKWNRIRVYSPPIAVYDVIHEYVYFEKILHITRSPKIQEQNV